MNSFLKKWFEMTTPHVGFVNTYIKYIFFLIKKTLNMSIVGIMRIRCPFSVLLFNVW